jgi:hypothetical protein
MMKTRRIVVLSLVSAAALYGIGAATRSLPFPAPWRAAPVARTADIELSASGSKLTELREVGAFDSVEVSGPVELILTRGDEFRLSVTHDAALLDAYASDLDGSTLRWATTARSASCRASRRSWRSSRQTSSALC